MVSLGTPKSPSLRSTVPGTFKGAQPRCPKKCGLLPATLSPLRAPTPSRIPQPPSSSLQGVRHLAPMAGQATPRWLDFADTPPKPIPRVLLVSPLAISYPPPVPPALLPVRKPISHRTRSRAQAPLALFTSGWPITNKSSTTFLLPKPPDQLRSRWPLRVSAKLFT